MALKLAAAALLLALVAAPGLSACYCIGRPQPPWVAGAYQVVVMDPDEADPGAVRQLASGGRLVLAYVNVGYAEEWRSYWPDAVAAGLVHGETEYEGEYYVEYWRPEWRAIIERVVDEALARGFNGVYLDNVDAYLALAEEGPPPWASGVDLREGMIGLVEGVAAHARSRGALAVYANLGGAAVDLEGGLALRGAVDGVLREEVLLSWEGECRVSPQPPGEALAVLAALLDARRAGLDVIVVEPVDYPWQAALLALAHGLAGFRVVLQDACDPSYEEPPVNPLSPLDALHLLLDELGVAPR